MTVKKALEADKDSGGPFLKFISTWVHIKAKKPLNCLKNFRLVYLSNHPEKLPLILFWYDVCDFNNIQSNGFDKVRKQE